MDNLKLIVSKNLTKLRQQSNLTQLELAQKIKYSDKSISKWERGESLPDLETLVALSEVFDVPINAFLEKDETKVKPKRIIKNSHAMIYLLSSGTALLVASIIFAILFMIPSTKSISWLSFIYAIPIGSIPPLILSLKWKNNILPPIFSSIILWGTIISICISISYADIWSLCVIGFVLEQLIICWFVLKKLNLLQKISIIKKKTDKKTEQ